jgi:hypothetical protein
MVYGKVVLKSGSLIHAKTLNMKAKLRHLAEHIIVTLNVVMVTIGPWDEMSLSVFVLNVVSPF